MKIKKNKTGSFKGERQPLRQVEDENNTDANKSVGREARPNFEDSSRQLDERNKPMRQVDPKIVKRNFRAKVVATAAFVLLLIGGWWYNAQQDPMTVTDTEFFQPPSMAMLEKSSFDSYGNSINIAEKNFNKGNYQGALPILSKLHRNHPEDHQVALFYGISLLGVERAEEALVPLKEAATVQDQNEFLEYGKYFYALALIETDQADQAQPLMEEIAKDGLNYKKQARKYLRMVAL